MKAVNFGREGVESNERKKKDIFTDHTAYIGAVCLF